MNVSEVMLYLGINTGPACPMGSGQETSQPVHVRLDKALFYTMHCVFDMNQRGSEFTNPLLNY